MKLTERNLLKSVAVKSGGDWKREYSQIKAQAKITDEEVVEADYNDIAITEDRYPQDLKRVYNPPVCLRFKGDIELLKRDDRILCDTLSESRYTWMASSRFIPVLTDHPAGLKAARWCIEHGNPFILVSSSSVDSESLSLFSDYCSMNMALMMSECYGTEPVPEWQCLRLSVGISTAVLIDEAEYGTDIGHNFPWATAKEAGEQGIELLAVPQDIGSNFTLSNILIQEGHAEIILGPNDIGETKTEVSAANINALERN